MTPTDIMAWRYATKRFDTEKKVSKEDLHEILNAARLAPSSVGLQPWKFVVVEDTALREKLEEASWNQKQITESSYVIVLCRREVNEELVDHHLKNTATTRNKAVEDLEGYKKMMMGIVTGKSPEDLQVWADKQIYIALGMMMESAAMLRIDSCPMEGFDPKAYDEILGLKEKGLASVVLCPIGYRNAELDHHATDEKVRFPMEEVVVHM